MRKWLWAILGLIGLAIVAFFAFAPGILESRTNKIDGKPLLPVSAEAKALHKTLRIVDLHSDTLMWKRDILKRADRGHEDLPRLQQGNVTLQLLSSVTKSPRGQNYDGNTGETDNITPLVIAQLQPPRTWFSLTERSLYHAEKLDRAVANSNDRLLKVQDATSLDSLLARRNGNSLPVGAMLTIEGLQNLEGRIENLDKLYDAGFRMAGLTHFFDNELSGSMHGVDKGGLTPLGRQVIRRMEDKGMLVDVAHISHKALAEVIAIARRPVVSSHGGVQAICKTNRNLSDDEIRGVARTGGLIGIGYWDGALCGTDPRIAARSMKHVRDLVGIQHVALGSDYDGATTVRFDTSHLEQITQALLDEGFTQQEIHAVMGENALRVLRAGIQPL
ncbi:dipeptidase [Sandaracinobacteroides hominis]|uniref:dipeptidase n=1 Tax=Sandaracinobacteroides hominis TaxID=2780086 RepID=UPI0018F3B925|nr:dipeptidase [Sandaracinobacteroides hominis]